MSIGKMIKYEEMLQHPTLRTHLPETYWINKSRTLQMLTTYSTVFIKPNYGSGGSGIIRVRRLGNRFEVVCGSNRKVVGSESVMEAIQSFRIRNDRYLVQRGIELAKYNGLAFDARIYMQKPESKWVISGMVARVAAPNKFVTNYLQGGHAETLEKVLSNLFPKNNKKIDSIIRQIRKLSLIIAETINQRHSIRELGIDLAIDKTGRIWIIEANSRPGHMLFSELSDKTFLKTIMRNKLRIRNQ